MTDLQKKIYFNILKKNYPDLHSEIIAECMKSDSIEELEQVAKIKQVFDKQGINDKRLFIAVVFKKFHPALYENDNKDILLRRGLNKAIADELRYSEGYIHILTKQVRTWLKYDVCDLRTRTENFYCQNIL